jgi:DHA1 family inner membrane transport protein
MGGLLTAALVERFGRLHLQWISALVMGACLVLYSMEFRLAQFALTTFFFLLAWNIVTPCQQALIAELDQPGRLVVIIPAAFALGVALGPALAGYMVETRGYPAMLLVCGGMSALALVPLLSTEASLRREKALRSA